MSEDLDVSALREQLGAMANNWKYAPMIHAVTALHIADHLAEGAKTVDALAEATGAHGYPLYRVMRALAMLAIFEENDDRQFQLTPLANLLREDTESSIRREVMWRCSPMMWKSWGEMLHTLMTGETAFNHVYGMTFFEHLAQDQDDATIFNNAMSQLTHAEVIGVAEAYDFSAYKTLIDIGGGQGSLLETILSRHPYLQGAVFDLPDAVQDAKRTLEAAGMIERCRLIAGSFFESAPANYDAYILKDILHDWDDEHVVAILQTCRQAMGKHAHLLVVERIIPPGNGIYQGKMVDITMLVVLGGRERTVEEYRSLLAMGGFKLDHIFPTSFESRILRALPT